MDALCSLRTDRARAYIAAVPGAIAGAKGHNATFAVACKLVELGLTPSEAWPLLLEFNQRCQPQWSERDLQHKLKDAFRLVLRQPEFRSRASHFRAAEKSRDRIDPVTLTENFLQGFRCDDVDLWEASPVRPPDDWTRDALALLETLYLPGEKINFVTTYQLDGQKARPNGIGETVERDDLLARWRKQLPRSEAGVWLRMNPLDGYGITDTHVVAFRFALIECDTIPLELQMPLLARLPLPISAILTSGGRSLHAWVRADGDDLDDFRRTVARMLALLTKFGVDSMNKNPSRMSRLPGVVRCIGGDANDPRQRLLYLNPKPSQKAIL